MPKKDVTNAVAGMLSTAGEQTRPPLRTSTEPRREATASPAPPQEPAPETTRDETSAGATAATTLAAPAPRDDTSAPRTLRLRAQTAQDLRAAWLDAKRDDVLLTAQDFASSLVDEALLSRRRRAARAS